MALTDLLLLGQGQDLKSERGVSCTGALPDTSDPKLVERAIKARAALGSKAMVLGHHYQRDEVIDFADIRGDSFKLAQAAASNSSAEYIVFLWCSLYGRKRRYFNQRIPKGDLA
jgi:quinolinate synthase